MMHFALPDVDALVFANAIVSASMYSNTINYWNCDSTIE
jgi:hypothetical protein